MLYSDELNSQLFTFFSKSFVNIPGIKYINPHLNIFFKLIFALIQLFKIIISGIKLSFFNSLYKEASQIPGLVAEVVDAYPDYSEEQQQKETVVFALTQSAMPIPSFKSSLQSACFWILNYSPSSRSQLLKRSQSTRTCLTVLIKQDPSRPSFPLCGMPAFPALTPRA